jgi:hypothetical protein
MLCIRQLIMSHNMWLLNPILDKNPIHWKRSNKSQYHTDLHHPPINSSNNSQPPIKNRNLVNSHPPEQSNLERSQDAKSALAARINVLIPQSPLIGAMEKYWKNIPKNNANA